MIKIQSLIDMPHQRLANLISEVGALRLVNENICHYTQVWRLRAFFQIFLTANYLKLVNYGIFWGIPEEWAMKIVNENLFSKK